MIEIAAKTDRGNVRAVNQDFIAFKAFGDHEALAVLCDGMGGHKAGEVASAMTGNYLMKHFASHPEFKKVRDIRKWCVGLIQQVNTIINREGTLKPEYEGMGTTIVLAYVLSGVFYIASVGDSRAYLLEEDGLTQITRDDTLVNALVASGYITELEAQYHPRRNVLVQAVGVSTPLKVAFHTGMMTGPLLLCSDGLYNSLNDEEMADILSEDKPLHDICDNMVAQANRLGGYDNISVMILKEGGASDE